MFTDIENFESLKNRIISTSRESWRVLKYLENDSDAQIYVVKRKNDKREYVLKLEPKTSGPLFCEFNFLIRLLKNEFFLPLIDFGVQLSVNNIPQRGIILPKKKYCLQVDLVLQTGFFITYENKKSFYKKIIKSIEYLNSIGYVNGDIKPKNIVFDDINNPYIIDFGLVENYVRSNYVSLEVNENGTIEYMSPDAHDGIISQRTDLISFGFILYMIFEEKELPWLGSSTKETIKMKKLFMENKGNAFYTNQFLINYFTLVNSRKVNERPWFNELLCLLK